MKDLTKKAAERGITLDETENHTTLSDEQLAAVAGGVGITASTVLVNGPEAQTCPHFYDINYYGTPPHCGSCLFRTVFFQAGNPNPMGSVRKNICEYLSGNMGEVDKRIKQYEDNLLDI
jgi:hypothetical protein